MAKYYGASLFFQSLVCFHVIFEYFVFDFKEKNGFIIDVYLVNSFYVCITIAPPQHFIMKIQTIIEVERMVK